MYPVPLFLMHINVGALSMVGAACVGLGTCYRPPFQVIHEQPDFVKA